MLEYHYTTICFKSFNIIPNEKILMNTCKTRIAGTVQVAQNIPTVVFGKLGLEFFFPN